MRKATGSYRIYLSLVKLQLWFLSLRWKTCLWAERSDDDDDDDDDDDEYHNFSILIIFDIVNICLGNDNNV